MRLKQLAYLMLLAISLQPVFSQAITITTGGNPVTGTAFLTFDQDVIFTINTPAITNPNHISFVIDSAIVGSDGSRTDLSGTGLSYQISTEIFTRDIEIWRDNLAASAGNVTPGDSQLYDTNESINPFPALQVGNTITLFAGTFTVNQGSSAFTVMSSGEYDMFVTSNLGVRVSGNGVSVPNVPVPAAIWLFGSGLIGLMGVARRKRHA